MEVSLTSSSNLPEGAIFSVRVGNVCRQSPTTRCKPFHFPEHPLKSPLKIELFQTMGDAYVLLRPGEMQYKVNFPMGRAAAELHVRLVEGGAKAAEPQQVDLTKISMQAKEYLESHRVMQFVQALLKMLIKERPADPFSYMSRHFTNGYEPNEKRAPVPTHLLEDEKREQNPDAAASEPKAKAAVPTRGSYGTSPMCRCDVKETSTVTHVRKWEKEIPLASGHPNSVIKDTSNPDYVLKKFDKTEARNYAEISSASEDPIRAFISHYGGIVEADGASAAETPRQFMRVGNLLTGMDNPTIMDCKLGCRSFSEKDVTDAKPRADLYEKMLKLNPDLLTEEERTLGAITKHKYMSTRDAMSSIPTLGFRIDGICSYRGQHADVHKELQQLREVPDIVPMLMRVLPPRSCNVCKNVASRRLERTKDLVMKLEELRSALQVSQFFQSHEFIGTSLLFVVDNERAHVHFIDLAKTEPVPEGMQIDHCSPWIPGNHEDGVLKGVESLLDLWKKALAELEDQSDSMVV